MRLKPGVSLQGIRPELTVGLMVAASVYAQHGHDMVVTSVCDGKHSETSLHYAGCAADLRTRDVPHIRAVFEQIKEALGEDFDIINEGTHLHIEYQPRR